MARWAGFVRNVMVGRQGLTRLVLLGAVADAGGASPVSYLSTGNVTFDADDGDGAAERCGSFLPRGTEWLDPLPWYAPRGDLVLTAAVPGAVLSVTRLVRGRPGTAGPVLERKLGQPGTTRNWNTIERILRRPRG